ncbi:MAG: hypothetical protein IJT95_00020, partial [Abditibacteriota bacterium]|nr:hypothetical protein [Abditibacteriota bacterium]
EQQNNTGRRPVADPNTLVDKGSHIKQPSQPAAEPRNDRKTISDWYATRRESSETSGKVPYKDFELRPAEGAEVAEGTNPLKVEREDVKKKDDEEKPRNDGSARLKTANSLLKAAIKAADMGNYDEMRKNALAAKEIYQAERAKGNKPEFCKSNIDTINTLLGY